MTLQLNEPISPFKEFYGYYYEQMPKLLAEGRTPMSVLDVLERRVAVRNAAPAVKHAWLDNYFDTSDAIAYSTKGMFKLTRNAATLRTITRKSELSDGALGIDEYTYRYLDGIEFCSTERKHFNRQLTEKEALDHEALKYLLGENAQHIITSMFQLGRDCYGHDKMLGCYVSDAPRESAVLRPLIVYGIDYRSYLNGNDYLANYYGRLVGVAPEARP